MAAREALQAFPSQSPPTQREILVDGTVFIKHPGVDKSLFVFPAYSQPDPADPSRPLFGVCHRLTLDACRVLTNHAADDRGGFLALDREGKTPVLLPIDDSNNVALLTSGDYYYFLGPPEDAANCDYPIVKQFSAFRFPSRLPEHWYRARRSARLERRVAATPSLWMHMSAYETARDEPCALTGYRGFNRCAHLVPEAEAAWFAANGMHLYSIENHRAGVRTPTNGVSLRADVHSCLESHDFVFYPAPGGDGDGERGFMAYFVHCRGYPDYTELFHRRRASIHPSVAVEFLYARFAYTVVNLWRPELFFDSVPDNVSVKVIADAIALKAKGSGIGDGAGTSEASEDSGSQVSGGDDGETEMEPSPGASNESSQSLTDESHAEGDERWKARLFRRIPEMAALEEVEHPPDVVDCHPETPHMMRLMSKYMKEHPQVWQTSTTPEGTTRDDEEGWYAKWMTRPL